MEATAAAVHAAPFVEAMPAGYNSPVAERGATLSVGQKLADSSFDGPTRSIIDGHS